MQPLSLKIRISVANQQLDLLEGEAVLLSYPVSTSGYGTGCEEGSLKTPLGRFQVAEKFGDGAPEGLVFRSRIPTAEFGSEENPEDLVQTRILWLDGLEEENANTKDRYIYIHGTNHESTIGTPLSHGCVRMRNSDVIELYDAVPTGTEVEIHP